MIDMQLPDLKVIEPVSYEQNKQRLLDLISSIAPDVVLYESSDEMVLLEAFAYEMTYADVRFNTRMKAALPSYAKGENLDAACMEFYGTTRLPGESDEVFLDRSLISLQQSVTTGSDNSYIYHTKSVDPRITHVYPYRSGDGETTIVWYAQHEKKQEELISLQEAIEQRLFDPALRTLCATRQRVVMAEEVSFDIEISLHVGSVFLQHTLASDVSERVRAYFETYAIAKEINLSKITSIAHIDGVEKVEILSPAADIVIGKEQIGVCNSVTVNVMEYQDV